jgi:hypothetical protein
LPRFAPPNKDQVKVTDASGKESNVLTIEVANPGGIPLLPRGADTQPHKALAF